MKANKLALGNQNSTVSDQVEPKYDRYSRAAPIENDKACKE